MKIFITATSDNIEGPFNPRFGRAVYFILVDSESREWEALPNPATAVSGGAGPHAVQFIVEHGAEVVISGRYGPSAFTALEAAGIKAYLAEGGTVNDVFGEFLAGKLESANSATGPGMHSKG
jgi:predicted Fe-Mo cluster-binding NifX family protein